jgi:DNA-binding NarL/FixJ family response regulator
MSERTIRVLVADDQALFREALAALLSVQAGIEVVGEAANGREAVEAATRLEPDVVLMDLRMPVLDGVGATRQLPADRPGVRVLALTTFDGDEEVFAAVRAGAVGYLLKDATTQRLVEAVVAADRGESVLSPSVAAKLVARVAALSTEPPARKAAQPLVDPLTERELDVLRELSRGASNREIARALFLTEGTVKNHVSSILAKLGARDRTQAALRASDLGLL